MHNYFVKIHYAIPSMILANCFFINILLNRAVRKNTVINMISVAIIGFKSALIEGAI